MENTMEKNPTASRLMFSLMVGIVVAIPLAYIFLLFFPTFRFSLGHLFTMSLLFSPLPGYLVWKKTEYRKKKTSSDYYDRKFKMIEDQDSRFMASWNWCSFMFVWMWYFYKGMWAKGLIILILMSLVIPIVPLWIYCGICGNWDYYLLEKKKTQFWQ